MIHSLRGNLVLIQDNFLVVECFGVGYKCNCSVFTRSFFESKLNQEIFIYTYINVRQDAVELFGFSDLDEMECFKLLTSVSGVGFKAAMAILSRFPCKEVAEVISSADSKSLTLAPGIGSKTAKRIILELKDKFASKEIGISARENIKASRTTSKKTEALNALLTLGYNQSEIMPWISNLSEDLSVEEIIKSALKYMSKGV